MLDFAKAKGWRTGENPAVWRGHLRNVLPAPKKTETHLAAMPYQDVADFLVRVRSAEAMAARCLEFTILPAARSSEARGAVWAEIDMDKAIWTVPGVRMKAGKEHRVPLSARAIEILRELHEARTGDHVFPGQRKGNRFL